MIGSIVFFFLIEKFRPDSTRFDFSVAWLSLKMPPEPEPSDYSSASNICHENNNPNPGKIIQCRGRVSFSGQTLTSKTKISPTQTRNIKFHYMTRLVFRINHSAVCLTEISFSIFFFNIRKTVPRTTILNGWNEKSKKRKKNEKLSVKAESWKVFHLWLWFHKKKKNMTNTMNFLQRKHDTNLMQREKIFENKMRKPGPYLNENLWVHFSRRSQTFSHFVDKIMMNCKHVQ